MEKTKGFINEFKEFISRGSVVDLAVGVIIGSSFTAIVTSLVNDIVMPIIGIILGGIDFTNLRYVISEAHDGVAESAINYGTFIQNIVNFLIIAFVVFLMVKFINRFRRKNEEVKEVKVNEELEVLKSIKTELEKMNESK